MENALLRKENETQLQYIKRITENKDILDLDYAEWSNLICGKQYSSENARKAYYIIKPMLQNINTEIENNIKDDKIITELDIKKQELEKEKIKIKDQRRRLNELIRGQARFEQIKEDIIDCAKELEPKLLGDIIGFNHTEDSQEAVLCLSDIHYGMITSNFVNSFDGQIAKERFKKLLDKTINTCRVNYNVDKLHVLILGDLVHGLIHTQNRLSAKEDVIKQIIEVSELIAEFIDELAIQIPSVKVYLTVGNHSRVFQNKDDNNTENFEYITKWFLLGRLKQCKNVEFIENDINDSLITFNVFDNLIVASHGDKDRPNSVQEKLRVLFDKKPSHIILGHYHSSYEKDFNGTTVVVNGSFCGTDDYAFEKRLFSEPYQKIIIFDKTDGEIAISKIKLN